MSQTPSSKKFTNPECPNCGSEDVTVRCDAYALYTLTGFDSDCSPILSKEADVQTFDDRKYICDECGYENTDSEPFIAARA